MTRREKFQDSNALIQLSRQLTAAAKSPAASAQVGLTSLQHKQHNTGVTVGIGIPSSPPPETVAVRTPASQATQQTNRKGKRPASQQPTGDTLVEDKVHPGKDRKLTPTAEMEERHHSNDMKQCSDKTHHSIQAANSQQVDASVRTTAASDKFTSWYTSTYTQVFAEELAAMPEGQDMSQSQLKLLQRVLSLGSSSFGTQHQSVLSQVTHPASQCAVGGHVSAWL